jgi:hypothetical protein
MSTEFTSPGAPRCVEDLALALHNTHSEELEISVSVTEAAYFARDTDPTYSIIENRLRFASLAARNELVARTTLQAVAGSDEIAIFDAARSLWRHENEHGDLASGRFLGLLHGSRDVFLDAVALLQTPKVNPHEIAMLLCAALPYLGSLELGPLIALCRESHTRFERAFSTSTFYEKLIPALVSRPALLSELLTWIDRNQEDWSASVYGAALFAVAEVDVDDGIALASKGSDGTVASLRSMSLWVLGRICASKCLTVAQTQAVELIVRPLLGDREEWLHRQACVAVANALPRRPLCTPQWRALVDAADKVALGALASSLFHSYRELKQRSDFEEMLFDCVALGGSALSELSLLDHILARLVQESAGHDELVLRWMTEWVRRHGSGVFGDHEFAELFDQAIRSLFHKKDLLQTLVTVWMLDQGRQAPAAAGGLLSYLHPQDVEPLSFDMKVVDELDQGGLIFLCRRLLGFVLSEDHLISLLLSLLESKDAPARVFALFSEVMAEEVGYDYSRLTLEKLRIKRGDVSEPDTQALLDKIISRIEKYETTFERLPVAVELQPSSRFVRNFARAREKEMRQGMREVRKKSIIGQIAKSIPIKGGIGFFQFVNDDYTQVTNMTSFNSSITLPRRDVLDPVGQSMRRLKLQSSQRGEW